MPSGSRPRVETDPDYAAQVSRILERSDAGETQVAIAQAEGTTRDVVKGIVHTYADKDRPHQDAAVWLLETRRMVVMAAAGFSPAEISRIFGADHSTVKARIASLQPEIDAAAAEWRATSLKVGFASREYRLWQLNQDLQYLEAEVPEVVWHKLGGGGGWERELTSEMVPRKFQLDQYGRPVWTTYRAKLLDEIAKLQGDHSATLHMGFNDATRQLLGDLNAAHGLPPPVVDEAVDVVAHAVEVSDATS
jgi:hypothetical protein